MVLGQVHVLKILHCTHFTWILFIIKLLLKLPAYYSITQVYCVSLFLVTWEIPNTAEAQMGFPAIVILSYTFNF